MKRIIDIPDEYYKAITEIPNHQCTADMLIIKNSIPHETVTEFADRCKECGARYGKLLEQQPCADVISRQAVLDQTYEWSKDEFLRVTNPFDYLRKRINSLPPVTPQEPILDKIRAEIDSHCSDNRDRNDGLYIAMKIIDKYKAEREVKE